MLELCFALLFFSFAARRSQLAAAIVRQCVLAHSSHLAACSCNHGGHGNADARRDRVRSVAAHLRRRADERGLLAAEEGLQAAQGQGRAG